MSFWVKKNPVIAYRHTGLGPGRVGSEFVWVGSGPKKLTRIQLSDTFRNVLKTFLLDMQL